MILVIVESPFAGLVERNRTYLAMALRDCLKRGEAPFASHGLYTMPGALRDDVPEERQLGIAAGLEWGLKADATIVYRDFGITPGMQQGINAAREARRPVIFRTILPRITEP